MDSFVDPAVLRKGKRGVPPREGLFPEKNAATSYGGKRDVVTHAVRGKRGEKKNDHLRYCGRIVFSGGKKRKKKARLIPIAGEKRGKGR